MQNLERMVKKLNVEVALLQVVAAITVGAVAFLFLWVGTMPIPTVKESYSTRECVEVINYTEEELFSCENLPEKYDHVWVK